MHFSSDKEFWYVLFVYGGKEDKVVNALSAHFKNEEIFPFVPRKDKWFIGKGKKVKEKELLFPSYVFIETKLTGSEFIGLTAEFIRTSSDIIRLLRNSDNDSDIAIRDHERGAWLHLLGREKHIEESVGFIEKDKVFIEYGPLKGLEGIIKNINRHKREALIETEFMGRAVTMNVAVQIIKKI